MKDKRKECLRMIRYWQKRLESLTVNSVNGVNGVNGVNAKEDEKGKETFPPAPPIEKRAKEEENNNHDNRVRARASRGCSQLPTLEAVSAFVKEIGSDIDPAYFWRYYNSNHRRWPREWRDRLRNWTANGIPRGRIRPDDTVDADDATPRAASPRTVDWELCAERCANCRDGKDCTCGVKIPPACDPDRPRPPEECPRFAAVSA